MRFYLTLIFIILFTAKTYSSICDKCGERLRTNDWPLIRIIGGIDAQLGDYPWQVSIHLDIPAVNKSIHVCGGTYISDQWILTAAHCLDTGLDMKYYFVVIGVVDLDSENLSVYKKLHISKFVLHNQWNDSQTLNDIALIKLSEKIDNLKIRDKVIQPICLIRNDTKLLESGTKCYATGWGAVWAKFNETNFEVGPMSRMLKAVIAPIYDTEQCQSIHSNKSKEVTVNLNTEICAGGTNQGGLGICVSDSGGPLQCQTNDNKWYQIGIISWTWRCAAPGVPDVYTRVSKYYDWIETTIKNNSN